MRALARPHAQLLCMRVRRGLSPGAGVGKAHTRLADAVVVDMRGPSRMALPVRVPAAELRAFVQGSTGSGDASATRLGRRARPRRLRGRARVALMDANCQRVCCFCGGVVFPAALRLRAPVPHTGALQSCVCACRAPVACGAMCFEGWCPDCRPPGLTVFAPRVVALQRGWAPALAGRVMQSPEAPLVNTHPACAVRTVSTASVFPYMLFFYCLACVRILRVYACVHGCLCARELCMRERALVTKEMDLNTTMNARAVCKSWRRLVKASVLRSTLYINC